jgi:hypothetical protein
MSTQIKPFDYLGIIATPATPDFVAADHFRTLEEGGIYCVIGNSFRLWFMTVVEKPTDEGIVHRHKLDSPMNGSRIASYFDREKGLAIPLGKYDALLAAHNGSKDTATLKNAKANLFPILDCSGTLRIATAVWGSVGWFLDALDVDDAHEFPAERLLFTAMPQI